MISRWLQVLGNPPIQKHIKDIILLRGGLTPYGEPRYRLVLGRNRFEQVGGIWYEWDENLGVNDRNYVNRHGEKLNTPIRTVEEMRWVQKYPPESFNKFILEKWLGPQHFGLRDSWPYGSLGAYPEYGDYESTGYEFPAEAVTEGIIANAIGRIERYVDSLPATQAGRSRRNQYLAKQRDQQREDRLAKRDEAIVSDSGYAFHGAPFMSMSAPKAKSDKEATADKLGINIGKL